MYDIFWLMGMLTDLQYIYHSWMCFCAQLLPQIYKSSNVKAQGLNLSHMAGTLNLTFEPSIA